MDEYRERVESTRDACAGIDSRLNAAVHQQLPAAEAKASAEMQRMAENAAKAAETALVSFADLQKTFSDGDPSAPDGKPDTRQRPDIRGNMPPSPSGNL